MLNRIIKFVAAILTMALLAAPLSAAGLCLAQGFGSHHCGAECPRMKAQGQTGMRIMASSPGYRSCCQASTTPPLPKASAWTNQNERWGQVDQLESTPVANSLPRADKPVFPETALSPSTSSYQALLCVFLL